MLLSLGIPSGEPRAEVPKPGTDVMRAAGSVEITVDGIGTGYVRLLGDVSIVRLPPNPIDPDTVPIEIVGLNLTGFSPVFGRVGIQPCVLMASTGLTRRTPPVESPSDSFFDVWYDISLPDLGMNLTQGAYFRIQARTTAVPFFDVFTGMFSQMVPLVDEATGMPMGSLTHVALDPNPRVDILATEARLDWTIGALGGPDTVPLSGRSIVVASDSFVPPVDPDHPEFNTEIVAMDLSGFSPMWGDTVFMEQVMLHSPGRSVAANPGPPDFPADSFFDVFFDIRTSSFDVFCPDPLTGKAMIDAWPPFGIPYSSSAPCPLFSPGGTQPMGTLDRFSWIWTQPMGGCVDADGDGVEAPPCGTDCDDNDPNNYPGNLEACADGRDNNCNQAIDCQDPLCLGRPCDDGDLCTQGDRCGPNPFGGVTCQGAPVDCDDNDPCTADRCDPLTGQCLHVPVDCDDQDPCTLDRCNPQTGGCDHFPVICNDGNQCTADSCDPATGACKFVPTPGAPCNDGDACTEDDRCVPDAQGGIACQGTPVNCDDGDACTTDQCEPLGCVVPDNGTGTATLPPQGCAYAGQGPMQIIDGLPAGDTIDIPALHRSFICPAASGVCSFPLPNPGVDCDQAGGTLGGEQQCAGSILELHLMGTGTLLGFNRNINLPVGFETHSAPRTPGDPVQSFSTDMFRLFGSIQNPGAGDPDFDLLRITGGTDFGMPSPGHTILARQVGNWYVDSFFDITYRIDFVGAPGGTLQGMSGSTTGTVRFRTPGGCTHTPVNCDDGDPCTTDRCNPLTGACEHVPVVCDDGNQCTADSCDPATGACKFVPTPGAPCDDRDDCTQDDRCVMDATGAIGCQGTPVNCDDQDPCTQDRCDPSGCIVPENGTGTATLPPAGCGYASQNDLRIIDGLPLGSTIDIPALHRSFICPAAAGVCSFPPPIPGFDCDQAGGSLGGEQQCADSILEMQLMGTGALLGFNRMISMPVGFETHTAPRTPGDPVQSFNTDMFRLFGVITNPSAMDPDFDLLRITGGTDFGMPSPGHTILTQQGGSWAVDSFFDITYRIDFVGAPGGTLQGMSGSTTGTARFRTAPGGCVHVPVNCDDQDPCTQDRCNPVTGACEHLPVNCDDQDPCTIDRCNPATGLCEHAPVSCDDNNVCTEDACNPVTGACEHRPIPVIEPNPLLFRDQETMTWPMTPDATHWNTYRGTIPATLLGSRLPGSVYDQVCHESDDSAGDGANVSIDLADPPRGTASYYLESGEGPCGESAIGHPSSGPEIPNTSPCPTPP